MGGRFKREGTYVYLWLVHVDVWQKPIQYYKAVVVQLKINKILKVSIKLQPVSETWYFQNVGEKI